MDSGKHTRDDSAEAEGAHAPDRSEELDAREELELRAQVAHDLELEEFEGGIEGV